jgi:hypothetical protein
MVKLYIHYKPENMNIEYIQKYFTKSYNKIELDSLDFGKHIMESNSIYRIEPNFNMKYEIKEKFYKNYDLIVDYTNYNKIKVLSQLPSSYIYTKLTIYEYKINENSNLKLFIEFVKDIDDLNKDVLNNSILKPIHFYFEYNENKLFNQDNINEEINEFLSLLI